MIDIFRGLGERLSEPTFRKYVQLGLLPRSRRVGRKGKHRGSVGVYPPGVVRRVNLIKAMMSEGLTLEAIRKSFVFFRNEIDTLERTLDEVLLDFERELGSRPLGVDERERISVELKAARNVGQALVRRIERIGSRLTERAATEIAEPMGALKPAPRTRGP